MPMAIARAHPGIRNLLLLGIVLPSWTPFLLRIYSWIGILKTNGLLNDVLLKLGLIDTPLHMLHTNFAVFIGIVYAYLPFMVLPLYTNLVKLDESYLEAAADLGAKPWKTFIFVTLPLVQRRHHCRFHARVHPRGGRIRDSRSSGRARHVDDRQGVVG